MSPLANLKILDFSTLLPGPYATLMLADLGADVVRIEAPGRLDLVRLMPPFEAGQSAQHAVLNRSKRSLSLDLKKPGAVEIVKRLVGEYDIVIEQFRPGVMDRLGVGYDALRAVNPRLIYCSLTGYGQTGPYRDRAGHDLNYLALSGILSYAGRAGAPPAPLPVQVADVGAGSLHLVVGLLAAVIRRLETGAGGHVDISMFDGALAWNYLGVAHTAVTGDPPAPESLPLNGGIFYDCYRTADNRLLSVGPLEPQFWTGFCAVIGRPDLVERGFDHGRTNQLALKAEIQAALAQKTLAEWTAVFATTDVCVEPVLTTAEAMQHPQTEARAMLTAVPRPDGGRQTQVACPIKMTGFTPTYRHIGTDPGAHTRAILAAAGYTAAEIEALFAAGTVTEHAG